MRLCGNFTSEPAVLADKSCCDVRLQDLRLFEHKYRRFISWSGTDFRMGPS